MAPADLRRQNKHTHIFDRGGSPTRPLACRVREPAVRCAAVQLMENNKTHKDLNYKPAKESEREKWSLQIITHFVQREKKARGKQLF